MVVIGSGMAGINAALVAQEAGAMVAVVERGRVGGTCPTRGCIPTKALIRSAEVAHEIARAAEFGIRVGDVEVDFAAVMERVRGIIERGSNATRSYLESLEGLELVLGEARLDGPAAVRVDGRRLEAKRILIATGAEPRRPPIPGLASVPHLTSDDVLELRELPRTLTVIGGGPIALELGQALSRLGSAVTLVEVQPRLLPGEEPELVEALTGMLEEEGLRIIAGAAIDRAERAPDGRPRLVGRHDGAELTLDADALLVATGRGPAVEALGLGEAGVAGGRGGIEVDARLRTSQPTVWAAGDVLGPPYGAFTHVARRLGAEVARNALGIDPHDVDPDVGPRAIFTDPELVTVGLTEAAAREAGHGVRVGTATFSGGKARAWGEERGLVKVVAEEGTGRLLGAHVLAYHGADLIHPVVVAMHAGDGTGAPILSAAHVHPTLGEKVKEAVEKAVS
jgi:pyruvate/2-oxoglutarate dehydrogenase complex dihydrolipoamide dehydrogenase (E3) component